jgi:hypothetical protein
MAARDARCDAKAANEKLRAWSLPTHQSGFLSTSTMRSNMRSASMAEVSAMLAVFEFRAWYASLWCWSTASLRRQAAAAIAQSG